MSEKRKRWVRLISDLILDLAALAFGVVSLGYVGYTYFTPSLRDQPFDTSLEKIVGHTGTYICFIAFGLVMIAVGAYFALKTIRMLRDPKYMNLEEPPFNPNR